MIATTPRTEWQLDGQKVAGPSQKHKKIKHFIVHWPGGPDTSSWPSTVEYLRNNQNYYETQRGYSLGYNFLIDRAGRVWEVRGFDIRNAANDGDKGKWRLRNFNKVSISCQIMCSDSAPINDRQVLALRKLIAECEEFYGRGLNVQGHGVTDHTTCPGDEINDRMGEIRERWHPPKVNEEDIMGTQPELHYYREDPDRQLYYWDGGSNGKYVVMGDAAEGLYKEKLRDSGYSDRPRGRAMGMARATGRVVNNPRLNPTRWVKYDRFGARRKGEG